MKNDINKMIYALIKSESKKLSSNKMPKKGVYIGVFTAVVLLGIGLGLGLGLREPDKVSSSSRVLSDPVL